MADATVPDGAPAPAASEATGVPAELRAVGARFASAGFAPGGAPALGHYACRDLAWEQTKGLAEMGSFERTTTRWTSEFDIVDGGSYRYRGSKPVAGTFAHDPASGVIRWTTGPYASEPKEEDRITGIAGRRRSDDRPVILLLFESPSYGESLEYCARVEP